MDFTTAFSIAGMAEKLTGKFLSALRSAKGRKRRLLLELKGNMELLNLWKRNQFPLDGIVLRLERRQYEEALEENFNLNSLKSRRLSKSATRDVPQFQKYVGWSTEKLVDNLYGKMKILRDIVELDSGSGRINKTVRLDNIYKMLVLIISHINS